MLNSTLNLSFARYVISCPCRAKIIECTCVLCSAMHLKVRINLITKKLNIQSYKKKKPSNMNFI